MQHPLSHLTRASLWLWLCGWLCLLVPSGQAVVLEYRHNDGFQSKKGKAYVTVAVKAQACVENKQYYVKRYTNLNRGQGYLGWEVDTSNWYLTADGFSLDTTLGTPFMMEAIPQDWDLKIKYELRDSATSFIIDTEEMEFDTQFQNTAPNDPQPPANQNVTMTLSGALDGAEDKTLILNINGTCDFACTIKVDPGDGTFRTWIVPAGESPTNTYTLAGCVPPGPIIIKQDYQQVFGEGTMQTVELNRQDWYDTEELILVTPVCSEAPPEPETPDDDDPPKPEPPKNAPPPPLPPQPPGTPPKVKPPIVPPGTGGPGSPTNPTTTVNPAAPLNPVTFTEFTLEDPDYQSVMNDAQALTDRQQQMIDTVVDQTGGMINAPNGSAMGRKYQVNMFQFFGHTVAFDLMPFRSILDVIRIVMIWILHLMFSMGTSKAIKEAFV